MFERYSEASRKVIFYARWWASETGLEVIEPRHLLLALLHGREGLSPIPDPEELHAKVLATFETVTLKKPSTVDAPLTPAAKQALGDAAGVCDTFGIATVEPIHLLYGVAKNVSGEAAAILAETGLTTDALEVAISGRR